MESNITIGHVNVYHLYNKIHDVCSLLHNNELQILGVTETKLSEYKHNSDSVMIPQYNFIRRDASFPGSTGIGLYIHQSLVNVVKHRHDLESPNIECLWLEVRPHKNTPILVGFIYRNPASNNNWFDDYVEMMDTVNSYNLNIILFGDFNIDLSLPQSQWNMLITMLGLYQLVNEPTRITHKSATLLDHIYRIRIIKI